MASISVWLATLAFKPNDNGLWFIQRAWLILGAIFALRVVFLVIFLNINVGWYNLVRRSQ